MKQSPQPVLLPMRGMAAGIGVYNLRITLSPFGSMPADNGGHWHCVGIG